MDYLFGGVSPLVRILVVGIPGFLALLVLLRIIGPRPLSRMQSYDVIFALAVGSTYGRLLTAQDTQLDEALVAFGILAGMHATVAWLARKHPWVAAPSPGCCCCGARRAKKPCARRASSSAS